MSIASSETTSGRARRRAMQLPMPDIDRVDAPCAAREQHLGEAAGRGADIEADAASRIEAEMIERGRELHAAARHPGMRRLGAQDASAAISSDGLRTGSSSAVTRPAAMAACALARLSNSPRSTSRRSMRWRVATAEAITRFRRRGNRIRRRPPKAGLSRRRAVVTAGGRIHAIAAFALGLIQRLVGALYQVADAFHAASAWDTPMLTVTPTWRRPLRTGCLQPLSHPSARRPPARPWFSAAAGRIPLRRSAPECPNSQISLRQMSAT